VAGSIVVPGTPLQGGGVYADACNNVYVGTHFNGNTFTFKNIRIYNFNGTAFSDAPADIVIPGYANKSVYDLLYNESENLLYACGDGFVTAIDIASNCGISSTGFSLNVTPSCNTATATLLPAPAAGTAVTYSLFIGSTLVTTNNSGIFTGLIPTTSYIVKAIINENCDGVRLLQNFVTNAGTSLAPLVTTPVTYCQGAAATALTATGTNLLWYTTPTGGAVSSTAPTPNTTSIGSTTYYVSQTTTTGTCAVSPRVAIVVNVVATPALPTVTNSVNYCQGATATALTASGTNLRWYTVATGGTSSTTAPTPNTAVVGSVTYYVSQSTSAVGGCEGPRASIVVNVIDIPAAPIVTTPIIYCRGAAATPLTATGTNLLWYVFPTGGTGSGNAPTPITAFVNNFTYYVTQSTSTVGGCQSPRAAIVVNIVAIPAAPAVTTPIAYCQGAAATPLTAAGINLLWYTIATGGTGSSTAITPSTAVVGTSNYYVSQSTAAVGGCQSPRASIAVQVNTSPSAPTVTTPITYCQGAAANTLTATGTNLRWYTVATGGTGSNTAPIPSTAVAGTVTYFVSQSASAVGGCESPRASIVVNVIATPTAPIVTTPIAYCQSAAATALTATGTNLLWYTTATGGTGSNTAPIPNTNVIANTTYYVSQSTATVGGCESPRSAILVQVSATAVPPSVSTTPIFYCQGATATALTAAGTNLLWYTTATGGTGSVTAPIPSTAVVGSTTYYVSQTSTTGACAESPRASIVVNTVATPAAPTVTNNINYCQGLVAPALTATGTNLRWYTVATGGTGSTIAPVPNIAVVGSTTYYVSQSTAAIGGCESPRASIVVNVIAIPAAPIVTTPIAYCQGVAATALTATGTNLLWYNTATGGTGSSTAPTPNTAIVANSTYYVSQSTVPVGGCESPRVGILVQINATPTAPVVVTTPITYCQGATATALTATGTNLLWYSTTTGGTGSATAPIPSTAAVGTSNYYVSQSIAPGGCESPRANIVVQINTTPLAPAVTSLVSYCQGATAIALTAIGTNLLWYTTVVGGTGSPTAPIPSTSSIGNTSYFVSQITAQGCESPRAAIVVQVSSTLAAPVVTSPISYCQGAVALPLTATGSNLLWYNNPTSGTGSGIAPIPSTAVVGSTTYYVSQSNTASGCAESPRAAIVVNITALLSVNAGNTITIAQGANTQLNATATAGADYTWTSSIVPITLSNVKILNPIANPLQTTSYLLTVRDLIGTCPPVSSSIQVIVTNTKPCINIRNAFTPNGDGKNDFWFVYDNVNCLSQSGTSVKVFNRYGSIVYENVNYGNTWDGTYKGKPLPDGTYYAVVEFTFLDGTKQRTRANVSIVR
jgi:large repetitive protein